MTLYYFCDFATPISLEAASFYCTLLKQLFVQSLLPEAIIKEIMGHFKHATYPLHEKTLESLLSQAIKSLEDVYIVCDGLDECENGVQMMICSFLSGLIAHKGRTVKVFVACREEERPLKYLTSFSYLRMSTEASQTDIAAYVTGSIERLTERGDLSLRNPSLKEKVISSLIVKADGM